MSLAWAATRGMLMSEHCAELVPFLIGHHTWEAGPALCWLQHLGKRAGLHRACLGSIVELTLVVVMRETWC